jgi:acyl-ACP thioesterase
MIKGYLQHSHEVKVAVSDMDFCEQIKPGAIMGYFQDIATAHAGLLGFGYDDMAERNLVWIMIRMSFKILKSPQIGETLNIVTLPEKPNAADVDRGYYIYDKTGELVVLGSSKWCALDINTHRPHRCTSIFEKFKDSDFVPNSPFDDANRKLKALPDCGTGMEGPFNYIVEVTDLDKNVHMNNARYGDIILNVCGFEMLQNNSLARVDINFMSELLIGERYEVFKAQNGGVINIEAKKSGLDKTVFRARAEWERRV